ncbi:MAG: hypothetical protein MI717_14470 [Spirochaetales bacterium]|nr:hypothetical protein [Spirochaetales bacterium]
MKKFLILHKGFVPPSPEIMEEWNQWFAEVESLTVEKGHLPQGVAFSHDGREELSLGPEAYTGYTMIRSESLATAAEIAQRCPFVHSTQVYEIMGG